MTMYIYLGRHAQQHILHQNPCTFIHSWLLSTRCEPWGFRPSHLSAWFRVVNSVYHRCAHIWQDCSNAPNILSFRCLMIIFLSFTPSSPIISKKTIVLIILNYFVSNVLIADGNRTIECTNGIKSHKFKVYIHINFYMLKGPSIGRRIAPHITIFVNFRLSLVSN